MKKTAVIHTSVAGYTLMEIMLVVAIIAVIAGGVIVKMTARPGRRKNSTIGTRYQQHIQCVEIIRSA